MIVIFLYFIFPASVTFLAQIIACYRMRGKWLRNCSLLLTATTGLSATITLLAQLEDIIHGKDPIEAVLWYIICASTALGYGLAWLLYFLSKKIKSKLHKDPDGLSVQEF